MITFLSVIVIIIFGAGYIFFNRSKFTTTNQWGDFTISSSIARPIGLIVLGIIIALFQPYTIERVDSGYKGIKINLTGSSRGVDSYQYKTGWVCYNSWTEQVLEFPIFQQHVKYTDQQVITKGGFIANIEPTFNYSLKEGAIGDMYVNLRLDTKQIEWGWLQTAITGSINDVANRWEVDKIFNNREQFESAIMTECNKRVSKWFIISQLRTNIVPPKALQDAINAKTRAIQEAEAKMQEAKTAEAEGVKQIAIAKADSTAKVIRASTAAKITRLEQEPLTPIYLEYLKIQKWNGSLPQAVTGGSAIISLK